MKKVGIFILSILMVCGTFIFPVTSVKAVGTQENLKISDLNFNDSLIDSETLKMVAEQLEAQDSLYYFETVKKMLRNERTTVSKVSSLTANVNNRTLKNGGYVFFTIPVAASAQSSIYLTPAQTTQLLNMIKDPEIEPLEVILSVLGAAAPYCTIPALLTSFLGATSIFYTCSLVNSYLNQQHINSLTGKASEQINIIANQGKITIWVPWNTYPTAVISDGVSNLRVVAK